MTFVPLSDIAGKSEESIKGIVVEKVTGTVTKALTAEALADAGVDIENLSDEALEAASEGDIAAALDEIANADIAGVAAAEAAEATKEALAISRRKTLSRRQPMRRNSRRRKPPRSPLPRKFHRSLTR